MRSSVSSFTSTPSPGAVGTSTKPSTIRSGSRTIARLSGPCEVLNSMNSALPLKRVEVQRCGGEQVRRPRVRDDEDVGHLRHVHDLARCGEAAAAGEIRLEDVDARAIDELAEAPFGGLLLAAGDQRVDRFRHAAIAVVVLGVEDLLDEERLERLERADGLNRLLGRALDEPAGVDQQVAVGARASRAQPPRAARRGAGPLPKTPQPNFTAVKPSSM